MPSRIIVTAVIPLSSSGFGSQLVAASMFPRDALKQLGTVIVAILASTAERQLLRGRTLPSCAPNGPELVAALLKAGPKAVSVSCPAANVSCPALPAPSLSLSQPLVPCAGEAAAPAR